VFRQSISTVEQDTNGLIKLKKVAGANRVYSLIISPRGPDSASCRWQTHSAAYVVMVGATLFP
jgi:hypothetical protein